MTELVQGTVKREVERIWLKSLEGAWIDIIQLPYYEMLKRRDNAMKMSMELSDGDTPRKMDLAFANEWTTQFDFKNCIADHNISDDQGTKMDFSNPLTFQILDPRVGLEIETLIANLNQEEEKKRRDFTPAPSSSSTDSPETPSEPTAVTP